MTNQQKQQEMAEMKAMIAKYEAEQAHYRAEIAALKATKATDSGFKVTPRGMVSMYGTGRFPVTLGKAQWEILIDRIPALQAFIAENIAKLAVKTDLKDEKGKAIYAVPTVG